MRIIKPFLVVVTMMILASCASSKKFVYLNDMVPGESYPINTEMSTVVHENDRLDIKVSCKNPELAVPFNVQTGAYQVAADGSVKSAGVDVLEQGYRVDAEGNIVFPILGKINVAGKSLKDVSDLIAGMIEEGNYIKDPEVSIEFLNFKYTVLGAVNSKGTYTVDGDKVTIIEAIAKAGDVTRAARLDRIAVIRMVDGKQQIFYNDLRTADIFMSPTYYLQQNDIVYVEPKYRTRNENTWQWVSFGTSLISVVSTILWALTGTGIIGGN
ncbi:MAG: polysaccharide biosynthesis/export family protein [Bacteroidales bacterium]|nr:polysaccharide biosynthesis/export family protein [Bacteroidales bacterium]